MPTWFWFVVALVALVGGVLLLLSERSSGAAGDDSSGPAGDDSGRDDSARGDSARGDAGRGTGAADGSARRGPSRESRAARTRERRGWADQKQWEFGDRDAALPESWAHGAFAGGVGRVVDRAKGAVPGRDGRRLAYLFDHEQDGEITGVIAAVRGSITVSVPVELRLPSAPPPDSAGLDSLGQIGERYAFASSAVEGHPLLRETVAATVDEVGSDVPIVWTEGTWVLACAEPDAGTTRMQEVLQRLVAVSIAVSEALEAPTDHGGTAAAGGSGSTAGSGPESTSAGAGPHDPATNPTPAPRGAGDAAGSAEREPVAAGHGFTHRDRPADVPYDIEADEADDESSRPRR